MEDGDASIAEEVERYLRSGHSDPHHAAWPGSFMERARHARADLRGALVREVTRLAKGRTHTPIPVVDTVALARRKVEPMVRGLFPRLEQPVVLAALEKSVVFVTSDNIESLLLEKSFDSSAWTLANLYLTSVGADLLSPDADRLVGVSEETICYVSPEYFAQDDPFADFIVHEAAHIFHNCKRTTLGLRETRKREWLLEINFRKRETFAYACEAYACLLARAKTAAERRRLADEYRLGGRISEDRVDRDEIATVVQAAAAARNGWRVILSRCAPANSARTAASPIRSMLPGSGHGLG